jgi:hypothetical protein
MTWKQNIAPLRALIAKAGSLAPVMKLWAVRYSSFVRKEFVRNSRGGGDWPDLKESTKRGRRGKTFAILRDTGVLFNAISIGGRGNLTQVGKEEFVYGFDKAPHGGDGITIQEIAAIHDQGKGKMPKRQILREPTESVIAAWFASLRRFLGAS